MSRKLAVRSVSGKGEWGERLGEGESREYVLTYRMWEECRM